MIRKLDNGNTYECLMINHLREPVEPGPANPLTMKTFDYLVLALETGDGKAVEMATVGTDGKPFWFRVVKI